MSADMCMQMEEIQGKLKAKLSKKRYVHTMGVRYTAAALAMRYGIRIEDASLAGLLHDCAKYFTDDELKKKCKKHGVEVSPMEEKHGDLLHAKLGAFYAREKYGVQQEEVLSAIRWHTTGKPAMSLLEEIVFTADYIEPSRRPLPNLQQIRQMAFIDLEEAVFLILRDTLEYLDGKAAKKKHEIEEHTVKAYEYYKAVHIRKQTAESSMPV